LLNVEAGLLLEGEGFNWRFAEKKRPFGLANDPGFFWFIFVG